MPLDLAEGSVTRGGGAQFNLHIPAVDLFQIERFVSPFPKQILAEHAEDGFVVMRIESRQVQRRGKAEFLKQWESALFEIDVAVVKGYRHRSVRQVVCVETPDGLGKGQDCAAGLGDRFQSRA